MTSSPKELPGPFSDPEENLRFPVEDRISGGALKRPRFSTSEESDDHQEIKDSQVQVRKRSEASKLVHLRELHGRIVPVGRQRLGFKQAFQDTQVSHPKVWRYKIISKVAVTAMEKFNVLLQTSEGQRSSSVLCMGSLSGCVSFCEITKARGNDDLVPAWPLTSENVMPNILSPSIFDNGMQKEFPGPISSIQKIGTCHLGPSDDGLPMHNALIRHIGLDGIGGTINVCNLSKLLDSDADFINIVLEQVASFDYNLSASACSPNGKEATIGTHKGAALVNLETSKLSWIFRRKGVIHSQKFDNSGNIVLCGYENGWIVPVDIRQNQRSHTDLSAGPSTSRRQLPKRILGSVNHSKKPRKRQSKCNGNSSSSIKASMPSGVCSLAYLASDDRYFLGSSFDGSIKLFDMRLLQRSVMSYEGHVNSNSLLELAVNSSETHFISGGEDSYVRIWNINTADLLFQEKFSDSIFKSICWPEPGPNRSYKRHGSEIQTWGAWLGSCEGLYYMHGI